MSPLVLLLIIIVSVAIGRAVTPAMIGRGLYVVWSVCWSLFVLGVIAFVWLGSGWRIGLSVAVGFFVFGYLRNVLVALVRRDPAALRVVAYLRTLGR